MTYIPAQPSPVPYLLYKVFTFSLSGDPGHLALSSLSLLSRHPQGFPLTFISPMEPG